MATILLVAAEEMEFAGLVRRIGGERLDWPIDFARRARRGGDLWLMAANGAGPRRAAEAVKVAAGRGKLDLVVSSSAGGESIINEFMTVYRKYMPIK